MRYNHAMTTVERKMTAPDRRLSVAPMMDWTDRHCRHFHHHVAPDALLFTEMVTADAAKDTTTRTDGSDMPREINGPKGPEPTRYGDWEQKGRCSDF